MHSKELICWDGPGLNATTDYPLQGKIELMIVTRR